MSTIANYATNHHDLIHDISFDFYGDRFATCSGDHSIKIWDRINGEWVCTASWKAHVGSIWRVKWAHPEFGQVIATCSLDRTAAVFEELAGDAPTAGGGKSASSSGGSGESQPTRTWAKRYTFVDSRTSVTDIKFAPKHMGLQLATCSSEGIVRIYEAQDVMNLTQWLLQHEIQCKLSCSSLSWSSSIFGQPLIAVGSNDSSSPQSGKVMIFELSEANRKWIKVDTISAITDPVHDVAFAPHMGRSFHLLAVASKDVTIITVKPQRKELAVNQNGTTKFELRLAAQFDDHKSTVWRVNWNITGTTLTSCGDDGYIRLWRANNLGGWRLIGILKGDGSVPPKDRIMQNPAAVPSTMMSDDDVSHRAAHFQIKRSSNWPYFNTDKDKSKTYY